jgi:integrase
VVPLSADEVARFWRSFRTFRDLSLIALMLYDGLRSQETLAIQLEDLHLAEAQFLVHGKGNKQRLLPLPPDTLRALENYLHLERPLTNSPCLFVSLKGPRRGQPMTPAGLRSLFRHHRRQSQIVRANPHRFRHTFGADMVRAGISLPALMRLMGHAHIHTTMLYVQLSPQDVWSEFHRALENRTRLHSPQQS